MHRDVTWKSMSTKSFLSRVRSLPASDLWGYLLISIVHTWLYNNTGRSVLALIAFHFLENFVGQMTSLPGPAEPIGVALRVTLVLAVVVFFGARPFRRDGTLPSPPAARRAP